MEKIKQQFATFSFIISLLIIGSALLLLFDIRELLAQIEIFIIGSGDWAVVWFIIIFSVFTVLLLPVTQLNIFAGIIFGPFLGTITVSIGSMIGAVVAFFVARNFGYKLVRRFLSKYIIKLSKCEKMIEKNGFMAVLILRLVPVFPFGGLSFFLGLTSVRFHDYFWGTLIGSAPYIVAFVYFGNSLVEQSVFQFFGAISVVLIGFLFTKMYKDLFDD